MDLILLIVGIFLLVSAYRHRADFTTKYQLFLVLGVAALLPFAYGFYLGFTKARANSATPAQIEALLSPNTFQQNEFPKAYVIGMMSTCLKGERDRKSTPYQTGKAIDFCVCETEKRVQRFTLHEQVEASNARWDPKIVPEAQKKWNDLVTECLHSVLK